MDQRRSGATAGNALEVARVASTSLTDPATADPRLLEVTLALARRLLDARRPGRRPEAGAALGAAAERFARDGRRARRAGRPARAPGAHLPAAPVIARASSPARPGIVTAHATRDLGLAVLALGGGRRREADAIDPASASAERRRARRRRSAPGAAARRRPRAGRGRRWAAAERAVRAAIAVSATPAPATRPSSRRRLPMSAAARPPEGRAARPPRGHRPPRPHPPHRRAQLHGAARRGCSPTSDEFAWRDFLDFLQHLRPRGERHPHRRGLPRRHVRVPRAVRRRGRGLRRAHRLARPRAAPSA